MPATSQWLEAPPEDAPEGEGSFVLRFGTALGLAVAAALAGAIPAATRVAAAAPGSSFLSIWLGLAAVALVPMVAAVVILRGARRGLRAFGGPGAEVRAYGMALWAAVLLIFLTYFGSVLRASTHHHGLAGATYAVGAGILALGLGAVCARIVAILGDGSRWPATLRHILAGGIAVAVAAALGWVGVRFLAAASRDPASEPAAGMVVDVLAFALASLLAARRPLASRRGLALVGTPVAVAVLALGISALRDPLLRAAIEERAPAFATVVDDVPGM